MLGIKARAVGRSIEYLGSETVPICMSYNGLVDFYNENRELITSNSMGRLALSDLSPKMLSVDGLATTI